jgi:hypothetical protein
MSRAAQMIWSFARYAITGSTTPSASDIVAYRLMLRANSSATRVPPQVSRKMAATDRGTGRDRANER